MRLLLIAAQVAAQQPPKGPINVFETPGDPWRLLALCAAVIVVLLILRWRGPEWWRRRRH